MTPEIVSVVLTGVGTVASVLFGVWRIHVHYENRNDAAHKALGVKIDSLDDRVREQGERLARLEGKVDPFLRDAYGD